MASEPAGHTPANYRRRLLLLFAVLSAFTIMLTSACTPPSQADMTRLSIARAATSQVGAVNGMHTPYSGWYLNGTYQGQDWCAMFASWAIAVGAGKPYPVQTAWGFHYVPSARAILASRGRLSTTPRVGDVAFVNHRAGHVGIVTEVRNIGGRWQVTTVEGNVAKYGTTGTPGVWRKIRWQGSGTEEVSAYGRVIP